MYIDNLRRLRDASEGNVFEKWRTNRWFLFHDNAPAHRTVLVKDFLSKNNVTTSEHLHTLLDWLQLIFTFSLD
jgi:aminoglycoside phosphotransferase (APT) family kinase protein